MPATILASLSGLSLTLVTAGLVSGCILVTYALCLDENHCPVFLPMISDTFVPIPGNYISRMVFSFGQFGLGTVMVMDYYSYRLDKPSSSECATKFWLCLTLIATVCMGIVGAVCESDTAPTCLSNGTLHTDSAVFLYITLDLYAISCALFEFKPPRCTARKVLMLLLPLVSVATKARWSSSVVAALSPSDVAVAVVEWLDTAVLMTWIVLHCKRTYFGDYAAGYVTTASADATTSTKAMLAAKKTADDGPSVLLSASLLELCNTFSAVSIGTVALTFVIATHNGKVDPAKEWPMLSDLWADKPTNMISRYFVCLGAGLTALEQAGHFFLAAPHRTDAPKANGALHVLSLAALLGLSGVGACNEKELSMLHFAFATLFFGGMGAYMVLDALWLVHGHLRGRLAAPRAHLAALGLLALAFNAYKLAHLADELGVLAVPRSSLAVLEWSAWITFLLYVRFHVTVYPEAPKYRLAIIKRATALSSHTASLLQSVAVA